MVTRQDEHLWTWIQKHLPYYEHNQIHLWRRLEESAVAVQIAATTHDPSQIEECARKLVSAIRSCKLHDDKMVSARKRLVLCGNRCIERRQADIEKLEATFREVATAPYLVRRVMSNESE